MRIIAFTGIITTIFTVLAAFCSADTMNYKELKKEFKQYDSSYSYRQTPSLPFPEKAAKEESGDELIKEVKRFEELKRNWKERAKKGTITNGFFDFETEKSKRIREAARTQEGGKIAGQRIDLFTLLSIAYERNPGLKAAFLQWKASFEKYSQVTRLDTILGQYQSFIKDLQINIGPKNHTSSVRSRFPFPGTLALKGEIAEKEILIAKEQYFIALKNLIVGITVSYDELVFLNGKIGIVSENLDLLKDLEMTASIKYSTGSTGFNDVIKAQIEISKRATDLDILKEKKKTVIAKINKYLNFSLGFSLGHPEKRKQKKVTVSLEELYSIGRNNQQELKVLKLKIEKANQVIILAEKRFYPDFTLGYSYFENDNGNLVGVGREKEPFSLKAAGMTPFWFGKNDAYVREARLMYQSLQEKLTEAENNLFYDIRELFFHLDTSERKILLYIDSLESDSLLVQAKKSIDVARREYEAGKIGFLDVLDAQKKLLEFSINYIKAVKEYNQSVVRLEGIIGRYLQN